MSEIVAKRGKACLGVAVRPATRSQYFVCNENVTFASTASSDFVIR